MSELRGQDYRNLGWADDNTWTSNYQRGRCKWVYQLAMLRYRWLRGETTAMFTVNVCWLGRG